MKTLNINSKSRIKLTNYGIATLKENHNKLRALCPAMGEFTPPKTDKDGFCTMHLWEVIDNFGKTVFDCNMHEKPFDYGTIYIVENDDDF